MVESDSFYLRQCGSYSVDHLANHSVPPFFNHSKFGLPWEGEGVCVRCGTMTNFCCVCDEVPPWDICRCIEAVAVIVLAAAADDICGVCGREGGAVSTTVFPPLTFDGTEIVFGPPALEEDGPPLPPVEPPLPDAPDEGEAERAFTTP